MSSSSAERAAGEGNGARQGPEPVCPRFHAAVELIGRRWAGVILFSLLSGPLYFRELGAAVPEMSDRLLSQRLRELEAEGLVQRCVHDGPPARVSYALTDAGRDLEPAIAELHDWAQRWEAANPPSESPA
ncbi:MAG TPA: helix-turn-helix domain-containing protein [Solirubrobacterales bacterium]|nr:helix-turn-helix domain-containing protein [Solirubrobacterales bacterium]